MRCRMTIITDRSGDRRRGWCWGLFAGSDHGGQTRDRSRAIGRWWQGQRLPSGSVGTRKRAGESERAMSKQTPAQRGFSMPAEWEPHEATWLSWPQNATDWPGKMSTIGWVYGEIVRKIAVGEKVRILVGSAAVEARARRRAGDRPSRHPPGRIPPLPDGSRLDARLRADFRPPPEAGPGRNGDRRFPFQRLGPLRQLVRMRACPPLPPA